MRAFTPEEKFAIVQEGRKSKRNVSQVCKKHGISRETFYSWERQIKEAALNALADEKPGRKPANQPRTIDEAHVLLSKKGKREAELEQRIQDLENKKRLLELRHEWVQFRLNQMPDEEIRSLIDQVSKKKDTPPKKNGGS